MAKSTAAVLKQAIRSVESLVDRPGVSDRELLRRFAEENDQAAFAALVRRYTGMVLGVCRRTLTTVQDAEDACQATFLVLARKATAGQWRQSVANWLYTTARRIASNARRAAERRTRREGKAAVPEMVQPTDQMTGRELLAALDEELDKLSSRYREPLVLCYLEGLTRDEVALRLGVPAGTVKIQLERGRKKLGDALTRRGCGLGVGLLTLAVASPVGAASPRLIEAVLTSVSGSPSAAVATLAQEVTMNALLNKGISAVVALIAAGVFGFGIAAYKLPAANQTDSKPPGKTAAKQAAKKSTDPISAPGSKETTVSGQVLSPAGKPVAGAELLLVGGKKGVRKLGIADTQGRFTVTAPRGERWVVLLARAPGMGLDFLDLGTLKDSEKVLLRLVKDRAIQGRVINTEGKPAAGVTLSVKHIGVYKDNSLDSFLAMWMKRHPMSGLPSGIKHIWEEGVFPPTITDKDGRFTIAGAGIERLVSLSLRGPGIAEGELWVVNRPGFDPKPFNKATTDSMATMSFGLGSKWLLHGPDLSIVAEAEKPIRGTVVDRETGKPRVGVKVGLTRNGTDLISIPLRATTDARGYFEIRGARKSAKGYMIEVPSDAETGLMACQGRSADTPGYAPIRIDIGMRKGVIITGRVIDKATGKSLPGFAMAAVLVDNPFAKEFPEFDSSSSFHRAETASDGTFRIVTIPGPILLMGGPDSRYLPEGEIARYRFKPPVRDPKYPKYFPTLKGFDNAYNTLGGGFSPLQGNFARVLMIAPEAGTLKHDIILERASNLAVKIVDSAGQPVKDTLVAGISPQDWNWPVQIATNYCDVYHLEPGKPRLLVVYDAAGKRLGIQRLKGDEKESIVVKLEAGGTVKGRLVDDEGRPLPRVTVQLFHHERIAEEIHKQVYRTRSVETDAEGKFLFDEVVPGVKFHLYFKRGKQVFETREKKEPVAEPGKSLDVGTIKVKHDSTEGAK